MLAQTWLWNYDQSWAVRTTCLQVAVPDKLREAPLALKAIYDADLAEEDIILAWHARKDAAKMLGVPTEGATAGMWDLRAASACLVGWLAGLESG